MPTTAASETVHHTCDDGKKGHPLLGAEPYLASLLVRQPAAPLLAARAPRSTFQAMRCPTSSDSEMTTSRSTAMPAGTVVRHDAVPTSFDSDASLLRALQSQVGILGAGDDDGRYDDLCVRGASLAGELGPGEAYLHYLTCRLHIEQQDLLRARYGPVAVGWTPPRKY